MFMHNANYLDKAISHYELAAIFLFANICSQSVKAKYTLQI